jgi:indolepyruvate ferredoxin oxidoreductase alpha subunit
MHEADYAEFGKDLFKKRYRVNKEDCIGCKACIRSGCPSISMTALDTAGDGAKKKSCIDKDSCVGCGVCAQICPKGAIVLSQGEKL